MLLKLHGVGPVLAHCIIKYRDSLGGYYSINQLKEIIGMKDELFNILKKNLITDPAKINKLAINIALYNELNKHPYISDDQAIKIIRNRKIHYIESFNQLEDLNIFPSKELLKIRPYFSYK